MKSIEYTHDLHCHRLAAWAASRAYSRGLKGASVQWTFDLLQRVGLDASFSIRSFQPDVDGFDADHHEKCQEIMTASKGRIEHFGRAAKLLNAYFKVRYVCGPDHKLPVVRVIHPPVDRLLLSKLGDCDRIPEPERMKWRSFARKGWSKFDAKTYKAAIELMRQRVGSNPLWTIERYWEATVVCDHSMSRGMRCRR